jgi:hypothetical protein
MSYDVGFGAADDFEYGESRHQSGNIDKIHLPSVATVGRIDDDVRPSGLKRG